ncbi:BPI-like_protein [Hexamita inflata]|uniref:BPI-like_protein n=1 Tax=Hexamita inflata TaxID=28002 RepID=A0ABP1IK06_9EUKA
MLNCIIISLCSTNIILPRDLQLSDSAQYVVTTTTASMRYMKCYVSDFRSYVYNMVIPDISFDLNMGVTQLNFKFSDVKISNMNVGDINLVLNQNTFNLNAIQTELEILSVWSFRQSSYPFTNDNGTAKFSIHGAQMKGLLNSSANKGIIVTNFISASADYESIQIQLQGGNSALFQSIVDLIMGAISEQIQKQLSSIVCKALVELINTIFDDGCNDMPLPKYQNTIKDARYTAGIQLGAGYLALMQSGYMYHTKNMTDEYMTPGKMNKTKFMFNKFNNDIQVVVHVESLNNMFYIFHKYENIYTTENYKVIEAPTVEFTNTVALLTMKVLVNESIAEIQLVGSPKIDDNRKLEVGCMYFDYQQYAANTNDENIDTNALLQQVVFHMNRISLDACYQFSFTHLVDFRTLQPVFDSKEQYIRLVGEIPNGCAKYGV